MLNPVTLARAALQGASDSARTEAAHKDLTSFIPLSIAHFQRLRDNFRLQPEHPLLLAAARLIAEATERCTHYEEHEFANRQSRVTATVSAAKDIASGMVGNESAAKGFEELSRRLHSLLVTSLTAVPVPSTQAASGLPLSPAFAAHLEHCRTNADDAHRSRRCSRRQHAFRDWWLCRLLWR